MKKVNAYQKIQKGKKDAEKFVLSCIKEDGDYRVNRVGLTTVKTFNALSRLEAKKSIKYSKKFGAYILA